MGPPGCCTVLAQWHDGKGHARDRFTKDIAIKDGSQECLSVWPGKGEKGGDQERHARQRGVSYVTTGLKNNLQRLTCSEKIQNVTGLKLLARSETVP